LFRIKRAQRAVQSVWAPLNTYLKAQTRFGKELLPQKYKDLIAVAFLRNNVAFLIDNLLYYLQVDVLEVQFRELDLKLSQCTTFEGVTKFHEEYLTSILTQTFQHVKTVMRALDDIFCYIFKLVEFIDEQCMILHNTSTIDIESLHTFNEMSINLEKKFNLLFTVLSGIKGNKVSPFLAQLLLRFDFNQYFSVVTKVSNDIKAK